MSLGNINGILHTSVERLNLNKTDYSNNYVFIQKKGRDIGPDGIAKAGRPEKRRETIKSGTGCGLFGFAAKTKFFFGRAKN
jgi:hypothetical protein